SSSTRSNATGAVTWIPGLSRRASHQIDGPARAVRCAVTIRDRLRESGLEVRAGVHTGECERMGDNIGGLAVHIGSRVAGLAGPGEVFASSTVKDLVSGSGIVFEDRGKHPLKGIPGEWRVFRVTAV